MRRRDFLIRTGSTSLWLVSVSVLGGCEGAGGSSGRADDDDDAAPAGEVEFTVDSASGHVHAFRIPQATLDSPPAAGFRAFTSTDAGHEHFVNLSQADLTDIAASIAVVGTTSQNAGHSHGFSFA